MGQNAGPENPRPVTSIDPSDVAHHLRVAADKYHENARILLEDMNEAIQALPVDQKPAYRQTREALAGLFDNQASDALRLAHLFDGMEAADLPSDATPGEKLARIRERLVAGRVSRPAVPEGRYTPATDVELTTAIATGGDNDGSLQHTPTTWIGNEQVNHQVGGA